VSVANACDLVSMLMVVLTNRKPRSRRSDPAASTAADSVPVIRSRSKGEVKGLKSRIVHNKAARINRSSSFQRM